jgi:hypothetical protein
MTMPLQWLFGSVYWEVKEDSVLISALKAVKCPPSGENSEMNLAATFLATV